MHWTSWNIHNTVEAELPKGIHNAKDVENLIHSNEKVKEKLQDLMSTDFWDWRFAARHTIAHVLSYKYGRPNMHAINKYINQFNSMDELQLNLWS